MPPRGQKRSYKIESMYYTLPTTKKNTVIKNQAYICVLKKVQEISHVHISISIA